MILCSKLAILLQKNLNSIHPVCEIKNKTDKVVKIFENKKRKIISKYFYLLIRIFEFLNLFMNDS